MYETYGKDDNFENVIRHGSLVHYTELKNLRSPRQKNMKQVDT